MRQKNPNFFTEFKIMLNSFDFFYAGNRLIENVCQTCDSALVLRGHIFQYICNIYMQYN